MSMLFPAYIVSCASKFSKHALVSFAFLLCFGLNNTPLFIYFFWSLKATGTPFAMMPITCNVHRIVGRLVNLIILLGFIIFARIRNNSLDAYYFVYYWDLGH